MIIIQHITQSVTEKILFSDISFKISEGQKVGFVGPNGAGKTTLLNIILGKIDPDSGTVITTNERIGYLAQKLVTNNAQTIQEYLAQFLAEEWEVYKIDEVLAKVGLKQMSQTRLISSLSGGQKMKVGLAGVLLSEPTTLLLDEPTNNLDLDSIIWLEQFVQHFDGKVLLISHDRYFLDACVNKIIELDPFTHKVHEYGGNYTQFIKQKQQRFEHQLDEYEQQQAKKEHMREWILQKQEQLKFHPNPKVASQLQSMKTRFEREILSQELDRPQTYTSFRVGSLGDPLHQKKVIISLESPKLIIFAQERIHLRGKNGVGKTTLLKSILNNPGTDSLLGYFSQEHESLVERAIVIDHFMKLTSTSESAARHVLGRFLFTKQKVFSVVKFLSEGEKARLLIAILINQKNDFLLLDEPTNHLDLESREVLATALQEYQGGFLIVSHDRYFIQQIGIQKSLTLTSAPRSSATPELIESVEPAES